MANDNNEFWELRGMIFVLIFLLLMLVAFVMNVWLPFKEERDYIKMEMDRSEGSEYRYWKHELKILYISHIPIVRWFFRKKY